MNPQPEPLAKRELAIEGLRLQTGSCFAAQLKMSEPSDEGFEDVNEPIHL